MSSIKLITVNIEKNRHYETVLDFLDKENPDVVCMQEVPETFLVHLKERGFYTDFAPMFYEELTGEKHTVGVAMAAKYEFRAKAHYYHRSGDDLKILDTSDLENSYSATYLYATVDTGQDIFNIATTHAPDTKDGKEDAFQVKCLNMALRLLSKEESHIICGDFNMPRGYNKLYEEFTKQYKDTIPTTYTSSLDRNLHRLGSRTDLHAPIFDIYMVDYIFTQPPYLASDVRLEFGVSDHAAVVATISKSV